jgi:arylsulfatase A-like enzyme
MSRPNIIFIFADQHRHDALGCAGNEIIQTPNLDRLASEGVRFANTWCQSPICQPSRASMISSAYPNELGVMRNFGRDLDSSIPTFMQQLQKAGYHTANVGKTHYYSEGLVEPDKDDGDMRQFDAQVRAFGFDHNIEEFDRYVHAMDGVTTPYTEYLKNEGVFEPYRDQIKSIWRLTEQHWNGVTSPLNQEQDLTSFLTRQAQEWLVKQNQEAPFFLQLSYVQPHVPLMADPVWAEYYAQTNIPRGIMNLEQIHPQVWQSYLRWCDHHANGKLLSDAYVLNGARQYYAMISLIDQSIGRLLGQLEQQGILENTIIAYSSDHGEMLGDHGLMAKFNFYRSSVQIPLIIRPPGGREGLVSNELVELVDVGPTLLDAAGVAGLENTQGRSILGLVKSRVGETEQGREYLFSEIMRQTKSSQGPTFRAVRNARFRMTIETNSQTPCEFYDLQEDPSETNNLLAGSAAETKKFSELMADMMQAVELRTANASG